jgi:ferredoxin-NADP reductase
LFLLFIHIADINEGLPVRDVRSLDAMLEHPDWTENQFLQAAQVRLRARYAELWQDYRQGRLSRDVALLSKHLTAVLTTPGAPPVTDITPALHDFLDRLKRNASTLLHRIGFAAGRRAARADVDRLLMSVTFQPPTASLETWQRGRIELRCVAVIAETADVRTFVLVPNTPLLMVYEPGQFVTLELEIGGKTVRRSYTISSSPSRPYAISITVKRIPGGAVSNWLHDHMDQGAMLTLTGPHGRFSCANTPATKLLLVAAGSGITPIMSMLRWLVDNGAAVDIVFINNVRTPADIIFASELDYLTTRMGERLRLGIMPASTTGHFSEETVRRLAPDFADREVFVCGPAGYMTAVRTVLTDLGLPMIQYHEESFGTPVQAKAPPVTTDTAAPIVAPPEARATVEVVFAKSGKTVTATEGDFLLDVAEDHVEIESSCRSGNCGTCRVIKTEGDVEMDEQTALSAEDIADGYVLTCVGRCAGDKIVLDA